jgi:hypothetical protein
MKKQFVLVTILVLTISLYSCNGAYPLSSSVQQSQTLQSAQPAQTLPPSHSPQPSQAPESTETCEKANANPVILSANGDIIGGWADGHWLTHSEAAAYCAGSMTFYKYSIAGLAGKVESSCVTNQPNGGYVGSRTADMAEGEYDENGSYTLSPEPEYDYGDYAADPFSTYYLYTLPPERMPMIDVCDNTADLAPVIQQMIDENLGKEVVNANIRSAVMGDIDGDSEYEKIVNADNCAGLIYEDLDNLYSICVIIESDGTVISVNECYISQNSLEFSETELVYAQNVLDIDGDGICEIVLDGEAWESSWSEVYKYNGNALSKVLTYATGA